MRKNELKRGSLMPYQLLNFRRSIKQSFSMQKQPPKVFYKKGFLNPNKAGLLKIAFFLGGRGGGSGKFDPPPSPHFYLE